MTKEPLGVCDLHVGKHLCMFGCANWRPVEASAPAAPPEQLKSAWLQNCCGDSTCEQFRLDAALKCLFGAKGGTHKHFAEMVNTAPPSDAAIEDAVRVVDRMTCSRCRSDVPIGKDHRGILVHYYAKADTKDCTAQGRAIVTAILPILRSGK